MTAPLSDERLAEIEARAGLVYDAAEDPIQLAGYDVPDLVAEIRRLRGELADANTWTDPDTGAVYDLAGPLRDADGDYWHHVGWVTLHGAPIPLVMWSPSPDRSQLGTRWSDVSVLPRVIEDCGPLTPALADEAEVGGAP